MKLPLPKFVMEIGSVQATLDILMMRVFYTSLTEKRIL